MISQKPQLGPGEARTRQRQRRQMLYIGFAGIVGGIIGFMTGFFDQGDGSLFSNEWDKLSLDPAVAIVTALLLLFGFALLPLYGFRSMTSSSASRTLSASPAGVSRCSPGFRCGVLHAGGIGRLPIPSECGRWPSSA